MTTPDPTPDPTPDVGGEPTSETTPETPAEDPAPDDTDAGQGHEAFKARQRLREVKAERDQLRNQLDALRDSVVSDIAAAAGVDHRLLTAADHATSDFVNDDGTVDRERLGQVCRDLAVEFKLTPTPRPPVSNPQQGTGSAPPRGKPSWSSAIKGR